MYFFLFYFVQCVQMRAVWYGMTYVYVCVPLSILH